MFWLCLARKKGLPILLGIEINAFNPQEVRKNYGPGVNGPPPPILDRAHEPPVMGRVYAPLKKIK